MMVVTYCEFGRDLTRLWLTHLTETNAVIRLLTCMNVCIQFPANHRVERTHFVALAVLGNERRTVQASFGFKVATVDHQMRLFFGDCTTAGSSNRHQVDYVNVARPPVLAKARLFGGLSGHRTLASRPASRLPCCLLIQFILSAYNLSQSIA